MTARREALILPLVIALPASAAQAEPQLSRSREQIPRLTASVQIDGALDEIGVGLLRHQPGRGLHAHAPRPGLGRQDHRQGRCAHRRDLCRRGRGHQPDLPGQPVLGRDLARVRQPGSVARYKVDVDDRFTCGVLGTYREGEDGYFNRVAGLLWTGETGDWYSRTELLFSYKLNPQTVLFLGYSDNSHGDVTTELTRQNRTLFAKVGYAFVL